MSGGGQLKLFTSSRFLLLWAAMLASSTGTFFLLLTVSSQLLTENGSGFGASAVFGFQWVLPIVMVGLIRRACQGARLRRTIVCAELGGAAVSLGIGFLLSANLVVPLLACFLVRGLLEGITKTARVVYARQLFDGPHLRLASYTFNNSYYLGSAAGGVLGSLLAGHVPVVTAAAVDACTFLLSACCYRWLPAVSAPQAQEGAPKGVLRQVGEVLRGRRQLVLAVVYLVAAVGVFQGFHSVARTVLPIRVLGLGDTEVMNLQVVSGLALVLGSIAVPVLLRAVDLGSYGGALANTLTVALMVLLPYAGGERTLYLYYFAYLFLFEFAFTAAQGHIIQECPADGLVSLTTFTNAAGNGLLVVCTLLTGALSDLLDFHIIALVLAVAVLAASGVAEVFARRRPLRTAAASEQAQATREVTR